ncbi:MAG: hypothetical protein IMY88_05095 [Chloroflexi bacterium]|nr:hypothetical protein [Chloroflexota bacterium]
MASKFRSLGIGIGIALAIIILLVIAAVSYSGIGVTCKVGSGGLPLSVSNFSAVPQPVVEDATALATELFGDRQEKCNDFVSRLLAIYSAAKDKDFVVVFNRGGWGYKSVKTTSGWYSILTGIKTELAGWGYTSLLLEHLRTDEGLPECLNELVERTTGYPSKARDLALRLEFLTNHIPDLKVIVAGESYGTVICDRVMNILEDNLQVYSIQTGPSFWNKNIILDRTLVLTSNGIILDSYSEGYYWAIVWGNLMCWLHLSQPVDDFGTPSHYVGAPGHDYWWQYPWVRSQITNFLTHNFKGGS